MYGCTQALAGLRTKKWSGGVFALDRFRYSRPPEPRRLEDRFPASRRDGDRCEFFDSSPFGSVRSSSRDLSAVPDPGRLATATSRTGGSAPPRLFCRERLDTPSILLDSGYLAGGAPHSSLQGSLTASSRQYKP